MYLSRLGGVLMLLAVSVCAGAYTVGGMNRPTYNTAPQGNVRPGTQPSGEARPSTASTGEVRPTTQPGNSMGRFTEPTGPVRPTTPEGLSAQRFTPSTGPVRPGLGTAATPTQEAFSLAPQPSGKAAAAAEPADRIRPAVPGGGTVSYALNNFTGGEFGDRLRYRVDLAKYRNGCRVMENFFPMPWGGVENRPGMVYLAPARSTGKILLIPFQFNVEQAYLIEATDRAFRFFRDGEVLDGHITTPYLADELEDLCWTQSNDVLFLAHPNHPPALLSRITTTSFRYETITGHSAFRAPFMDENSDGIALSYTAYPSGGIAISSSDALFVSSMEGAEIKWSSPISGNAMNHLM